MGRDKAVLPIGEKTLLEHMIQKVQALGISDILVSGWKDCPAGTIYVPDIYPHRGPLSGIHAGLLAIQNRSALILPVDMPLLSRKTLLALAEAHGDHPITVLGSEPLPVICDARLAPLCERLLQEQNHSLRRFFSEAGMKQISDPDSPFRLMNCNTPEDYETVQRIFRTEEHQ